MNQTLTEYLINKEARTNTAFHFNGATGQKGYLLTANVIIAEESFKEMYPLGSKITLCNYDNKGENPVVGQFGNLFFSTTIKTGGYV